MRYILCTLFTFLLGCGYFVASAQQVSTIPLDTLSKKVVTDIIIEGNKKTKERIILREMTFEPGDTLFWGNLRAGMDQSQNNIMNLGLFNFVEIKPLQIDNDHVIVLISVTERWYIYPVPIIEIAQTNFSTWWKTKEIRWLNYGFYLSYNNFRGRNENIKLTLRFGYTKKFSASYSIPNVNRKQTLSLYFEGGFFENQEIVYNTNDNERLFYNNPDKKARKYYQYKAGIGYREDIFLKHYFELSYIDATVQPNVLDLQPNYFAGGVDHSKFLRATYILQYDSRDYKRYPLKGLELYGTFQQDGLGIVNRDGLNLFTTQAGYNQYYKLGERIYFAHSLTGKINWNKPSYYLTQGLGYGDLVRGYEFYIIDGTRWGLLKTNLKYQILKTKEITLPVIKSEKFNKTFVALYGNLFFDAGYVDGEDFSENNSLVNQYIYSFGIGLDLVTYYDKVMRVEGSVNAQGQIGVYVAFKQSF